MFCSEIYSDNNPICMQEKKQFSEHLLKGTGAASIVLGPMDPWDLPVTQTGPSRCQK